MFANINPSGIAMTFGVGDTPRMSRSPRFDPRCYARRRTLLAGMLGSTLFGIGTSVVANAGTHSKDPRKLPPQIGDELVRPSWEDDGRVISVDELPLNGPPLLAYPRDPAAGIARERSRLNQILLVRFEDDELSEQTRAVADGGIVAYSGICTHEACGVSEWNAAEEYFICPCHASEFDPRNRAAVVGGPARRALPALPIKRVGRNIVVAGKFTNRVGAKRK